MEKRVPQKNWSKIETEYLKENYGRMPRDKIARKLHRTLSSIINKIHYEKLRLRQLKKIGKSFPSLTETEKAYIAGFLDGEGSIVFCVYHKKGIPHRATPMIEIANNDREIMNWLAIKINGFAKWKIPCKVNRNYLTKEQLSRIDDTYHLSVTGRFRIEPLLRDILPYLHIKKEIAEIVLIFYQQREDRFQKKFSIKDWKLVLKNRQLIDSRQKRHIRSRQHLARFIKELETRKFKDQEDI